MEFWVDIEDAAGNRLGAGPITSAAEWRSSPRLDEAGEFSFSMPAADPQAALLANRRIARCWAVVDGAVKQISAGIIDTIEVEPGEPTMLRVSGPDLLAELAGRTIPRLTVCEQALQYLTLNMDTGHWRGSVRWISNRYGATFDVDLPAAHDAVVDTGGELITMWSEGDPNIEYLYVGCDARFDYVRIWLGDYLETNRRASSLIGQYYDGNGWADLPDMVDGTMGQNAYSEWCTFNQNGVISFSRPADWARVQPTAQAGSWFWVRFTVQPGQVTDEIRLREAAVWADVPTTGGVTQIMAYAPDTWVRTGYPATTSAKYLEIEGESVLAALRSLSEQGGQDGGGVPVREHFRLGAGRSLAWFSQFSASGVRAVRAPATGAGLLAAESRGEVCFIRSLTERRDTAEVVTRLYPTSNDGVTLHLTTRSAPAGYSLSKVDGYLQNDAGASLHGRIEASVRFTDVSMQQADSWYEHPSMAANALFDRALEYLRTHGVAQRFYDLEIVKAGGGLLPGHTLRVVYHEYADGHHAVDIDADLCVLGVTQAIDADGLHTVGVEASTVDRQAMDDVDVLRNAVQDGRRSGQVVSGMTVITAGQGSGHGGGASFPGTVSLTTINTDTGAEHFHRMDISPHLSNAAAHHAPVTVSNQGLSLSGQALGLKLAANPGLEIASGLRMGTPGTLTAATANAVTAASHAHAVTTGAPGAVRPGDTAEAGSGAALARADHRHAVSAGTPVAVSLAANAEGAATAFARADHQHHLDEAITPTWTGAHQFQATVTARSILPEATDTYDLGSALRWWREQYVSQINAAVFAEATAQLLGGWLIVGHDQGSLGAAVGPTDTAVDFGDLMTPGDMVVIRSHDAGGAVKAEYLQVGALVSGTTYNVTRDLAGAHATDPAWPAGTPYLVLGQAGAGRVELNAYDTPRISLIRQGAAYNAQAEVVRIGDLNGGWGYGAETYGVALGEYAAGRGNLVYDQANGLRLRTHGTDKIVLDNAGNAYFAGVMTIGTNGEIRQGTGSPGSDFTGLRIWRDGNIGRIAGYNNNEEQWYANTDGKLYAGGGNTLLSSLGLHLLRNTQYLDDKTYVQGSGVEWGHYSSPGVWETAAYITETTSTAEDYSDLWRTLRMHVPSSKGNTSYDAVLTLTAYHNQPSSSRFTGWLTADYGLYVGQGIRLYGGTGDAKLTGGLNVGSATGALAGEVRGTGSENVLEWILANSKNTDPALVQIGVRDSQPASLSLGRRDPNDATYTGYGAAGDGYLYNGGAGRALNIIVSDATNGALRVYVGSNAKGNARLTIDKNGVATFHKALGCGIGYTPGDGNIDAAGYVRGQKGLVVGEGQSAPTAASGIAFIWVDSNGNLKITFGDGTTKTIISKA